MVRPDLSTTGVQVPALSSLRHVFKNDQFMQTELDKAFITGISW